MEPLSTPLRPLHCGSYFPGHDTHWIPVLKVYLHAERHPVVLQSICDDGWMTFTSDGQKIRRWHHGVKWIRSMEDLDWCRVGESEFFEAGGSFWVCTGEVRTPCPDDLGPPAGGGATAENLVDLIAQRGGFSIRGSNL
jgi:hypothetical protein